MESSKLLCDGVTLAPGPGGLPCVQIKTSQVEALVSLQGAQVLTCQMTGQEPLLWLSPTAIYAPGKAIRGGVPLCWPWFGPHRTDPTLGQHGFARLQAWQVIEASTKGGTVELSLGLEDSAETRQRWPFAFKLRLDLRFDAALQLTLHALNTGDEPWPWQAAFHPYLLTRDVSQCSVQGLQGLRYYDRLGTPGFAQEGGEALAFDRAVDRTYLDAPDRCTLAQDSQPAMLVEKQFGSATVTWTPGPDLAKAPADLPAERWKEFVCLEALSSFDPAPLASGHSAQLGMRLSRPA